MSLTEIQGFIRRNASALFILVGALLLTYVAVEYAQMFWNQRSLERQWEAQQKQLSTKAPRSAALKDDGLTRLSIPRIDLAAVVMEGTDHRDLLLGPGHMKDTPAPGQPGNSVITGHRDTFFRHIYELDKGDEILVQRNGKTFRYAVVSKHVVQPTDMSVVRPSQDARLTLITCYPTYYIGPAPERLVVTSKLLGDGTALKPEPASVPIQRTSQRAIVH